MVRITQDSFFDDVAAAFAADDPEVEKKHAEAERVRCVQLLYHAIARGAFTEMLQLTTDDFVLEIVGPPSALLVGRWQGRDQVLAAIQHNFSLVTDQQPQVQTVVAQGDIVVVIAREQGKWTATGAAYDVHWVQVFSFRNGRVKHVRQIFDGVERIGGT